MSGEPKKTGSAAPSQKSKVVKRSVMIDGHQTSVSLEDDFWVALHEISAAQGVGISELAATIDHGREHANLSSAIRLYVLDYYQRLDSGRTPKVEATPATDLPCFQVEDWVRVRPQTILFADLLGIFLKVVAVEERASQIGSYVADVETPDGERRRGIPADELELVKF